VINRGNREIGKIVEVGEAGEAGLSDFPLNSGEKL